MMETKFTPGPWSADFTLNGKKAYILTPSGYVVAEVPLDRNYKRQAATNARLFAAAPDLYEAAADAEDAIESLTARLADCEPGVSAQEAYDSFYTGNLTDALDALRAALAKARGES